MRPLRGHRKLIVWRRAMQLVVESYAIGGRLPSDERFGLRSQLQRASVSVAANIAEGNARRHPREYAHFLSIARGSVREVETYLDAFHLLGFIPAGDLERARSLSDEVSRMLFVMIRSLEAGEAPGRSRGEP